ncbi:MAG: hypothetical protein FD177_1026 [Desulfovibrionaceae bacterium]|nr:MAG: hypothetical protein FD177_1026 [Desulfovibrionaceae bacterium]
MPHIADMNTAEQHSDDFELLLTKYGSHSKAAKALGMSIRHYRKIRSGQHSGGMALRLVAAVLNPPSNPTPGQQAEG